MNDILKPLLVAISFVAVTSQSLASFNSGSDESDGVLNIAGGQGVVVFDPDAFSPVLDPDRDGIYHFTTITIGDGTTVQLRADVLGHKPLIWLASGNVSIEGNLDASTFASGINTPGVGGFYGGKVGGVEDGQGPGGTAVDSGNYPSDDHLNPYLIPLVGRSGSGADVQSGPSDGTSGGGALLIASSTKVDFSANSSVYLYGGNMRLIANEVSGELDQISGAKILRIEAFSHSYSQNPSADTLVKTRPGAVFPTNPIKITLIDSLAVDQTKPGANKGVPDVTIDDGGLVTVKVECVGIPLGTTIRVVGWNDTVGKVEATTGPLTGTVEASEATCDMIIPTGNTTFMAQAVLAP